jgi:hypothetical protein
VVRDCVGYRSVGHGFFLEDGTEVYNVLDRNRAAFSSNELRIPTPYPVAITELRRELDAVRRQLAKKLEEDKVQTADQRAIWDECEKQARVSITKKTVLAERGLDTEIAEAKKVVDREYQQIRKWHVPLVVLAILGILSLPILGLASLAITVVFGTWLVIQKTLFRMRPDSRRLTALRYRRNQLRKVARQELKAVLHKIAEERKVFDRMIRDRRRQLERRVKDAKMAYEGTLAEEMLRRRNSFRVAERKLMDSERKWSSIADQYSGESRRIKELITGRIPECRLLTTQYQTELKRLTGNAEAAARLRHLRLHLIADADIPKIGEGRKQVLASHTVLTAADINEHTIREIGGFGDVLTSNLLTWKEGVLRQFYFNPATALSPAELRELLSIVVSREFWIRRRSAGLHQ